MHELFGVLVCANPVRWTGPVPAGARMAACSSCAEPVWITGYHEQQLARERARLVCLPCGLHEADPDAHEPDVADALRRFRLDSELRERGN